jgi:hypothetical protein
MHFSMSEYHNSRIFSETPKFILVADSGPKETASSSQMPATVAVLLEEEAEGGSQIQEPWHDVTRPQWQGGLG